MKKISKRIKILCLILIMFVFNLILFSNKSFAATINFDISQGNVSFTDSKYTGKDSSGNTVTGTHSASNEYIISQTDSGTKTTNRVLVGTSSTAVTKDFIIKLAGVNIRRSTDDYCAFAVYCAGDSDVVIILQNSTNNYLYSGKGRAGLEKSGGASNDGTLVVTCEKGYTEWKNDRNKGHLGSDGFSGCTSTCGHLNAKSGNAWSGTSAQTLKAGAGIGTAGDGTDGSTSAGKAAGTNALVNLTIAGGRIYATGAWGKGSANNNIGENYSSGGGAGIGTGSAGTTSATAGTVTGLKITGGTIRAYRGDCSAACIGGGYRSGYADITIYGGTILAQESSSKIGDVIDTIRAPSIGGGGGGTQTSSPAGATVTIYNGRIEAYSQYGAAIGGGAGGEEGNGKNAIVNIYGGQITATTEKGSGNGAGAAIGTGGSLIAGKGGEATVNIYGGTVIANSEYGADIGGGGTNSTDTAGVGGNGIVNISGGDITANTGGIGGGNANAGVGGDATVNISGGKIKASNIGGGKSTSSDGGTATVTVSGTADITLTGGIGGGISSKKNGGNANINISGGSLICNGSIGGGDSTSKSGGTAEVTVTGGYLKAKSIGGGNSTSGNGGAANIHITDGTIKTGSIGGGVTSSSTASMGYATALIEGGDIIGQFIMAKGTTTPCTFTMTGGNLHDSNTSDTEYIHLQKNGGALYMDDPTGIAKISGGTIQSCKAENGGAIFINGGDFELSGTGRIKDSTSTNGGAVYVSGGNVTINGGSISNSKAKSGGGIYISNGDITMNGGNISNNQAEEYGGGIYASSNTDDLVVTITSGSITGNIASKNGGGVGVNMREGLAATITVGLEPCKGIDTTHSHPIIKDNTANENGGGFWLNGDSMTMNMYCGSIKENLAILEPGSANLYQTGGKATVHSGEIGEGVIVIGGEYDYLPESQIPEITITYNSNIPDNSEIKTALITVGVEIYLPKNLFKRDGYVLVGWAHTPNPTEEDRIYTVGEPYLVGEENITVYAIWYLEGSGKIQKPVIVPGKNYQEITGGANIMISSNASFTAQMSVLELQPNYYTNRILSFDKNLPVGTNITMVELTDINNKEFYYYKVESDNIREITLSSFTKNGKEDKYKDSTSSENVDEKFLFVLELPKENQITGAMQITLTRNAVDNKIAAIEQTATFTTTEKTTFEIDNEFDIGVFEKPTIDNNLKISYIIKKAGGEDTRYEGKNAALVLKPVDNNHFSENMKVFDGENEYKLSGKNQFIIPLGSIEENKEMNLKLISDTLSNNEIGINFNCELMISKEMAKPGMGEKVAEIENIILNAITLPAAKFEMDKKSHNQEAFDGTLKLNYETLKLNDYYVTLELQKKVSNNSYVTQTGLLNNIDGKTENTNGVFNLELNTDGNINIEFIDGFENQVGTYRILLKVIDINGKEIEIPCNFMMIK